VSEKFTSVTKVHYEVQFGVGLEGVVQLNDKRRSDFLEDVTLGLKQLSKNILP